MGIGTDTNVPFGILGAGYAALEAVVDQKGEGAKYDNVPVTMAKSGAINSIAYSLWLNDQSRLHH
jgi:hypothetical protein